MTLLTTSSWNNLGFPALYFLAFLALYMIAKSRKKRILESFNPPAGSTPELTHPIDIAYLAGGIQRSLQVALISLLENKQLKWSPGQGGQPGKLRRKSRKLTSSHWLEKSIYDSVALLGKSGLSVSSLAPTMLNNKHAFEAKLSKLGLRPTSAELSSKRSKLLRPLGLLVAVGIYWIIQTYSMGQSLFLPVLLVIATLFGMRRIYANFGRLSPTGERFLERLKTTPSSPQTEGLMGVSLYGLEGISLDHSLPTIDSDFLQEFDNDTYQNSSPSGCGGEVGCGAGCGSGCGGGGGCGGGCGGGN